MAGDFLTRNPQVKASRASGWLWHVTWPPASIKFISRFSAISKKIPSLDAQRAGNLRAPFGFFSFLENSISNQLMAERSELIKYKGLKPMLYFTAK